MEFEDTIAAVATAPGIGAIGVVRASGPGALKAAQAVFSANPGERIAHRHATLGSLIDPGDGVAFDEALLTYFQGPNSYTRQDLVEISCHGGPAAVAACLRTLLLNGCRRAGPGEFTLRAFLSGRIDLARAEAVADMVSAPNDLALKAARAQLSGALSDAVANIRRDLLDLRARLEAEIDFSEDDVPAVPREQVGKALDRSLAAIAAALEGSATGELLRSGVRITIVGAPNAGKSSTLNRLLGRDRAIVTAVAGTTRDVLEEALTIDGVAMVLSDTAGVRSATDAIEAEGISRTGMALADADLAILVIDGGKPLTDPDRQAAQIVADAGIPAIVLINKSDLELVVSDAEIASLQPWPSMHFSALTGSGQDGLRAQLSNLLGTGGLRSNDLPRTTNERHVGALARARVELGAARRACGEGLPSDFVCIGLAGAIAELGQITGQDATEDLLDAIFSKFCIGK